MAGRRNFFREPGDAAGAAGSPTTGDTAWGYTERGDTALGYTAMMIDFGFCFNAGQWDFPDAPVRGLYARHRIYEGVAGMEAFEPWLARLENRITERALGEEAAQIPPEWYGGDRNAFER